MFFKTKWTLNDQKVSQEKVKDKKKEKGKKFLNKETEMKKLQVWKISEETLSFNLRQKENLSDKRFGKTQSFKI